MTESEHRDLMNDLSAYVDGELPAPRVARIERLLAESPEARDLVRELRSVSRALHGLPRAAAPPSVREQVRAARLSPPSQASTPRRTAGPWLARRAAAAVSAAAVLLAAVWVGRFSALHGDFEARRVGLDAESSLKKQPRIGEADGDGVADLARRRIAGLRLKESSGEPAPAQHATVAGQPVAQESDPPGTVTLLVAPRTAEEYVAAIELVAAWGAGGEVVEGAILSFGFPLDLAAGMPGRPSEGPVAGETVRQPGPDRPEAVESVIAQLDRFVPAGVYLGVRPAGASDAAGIELETFDAARGAPVARIAFDERGQPPATPALRARRAAPASSEAPPAFVRVRIIPPASALPPGSAPASRPSPAP